MTSRRPGGGFWISEDIGGIPQPPPPFTHVAAHPLPFGRAILRVADPRGRMIGQLFGNVQAVSSRADGYGTATLLLSPAVMRARPNLVEFGNRLRIDFNNGLRPWVGVIDAPRELAGGLLRVQAYEPAYLLTQRLTGRLSFSHIESAFISTTIASLMVMHLEGRPIEVIERDGSDAPPPTPLAPGFSFETVLAALDKLRDLDPWFHYHSGCDFLLGDEGKIDFQMYMYRGAWANFPRLAVLQQGINFSQVQMMDQGPVANRVIVASGDADIDGEGGQQDNEQLARPPWRPDGRYHPVYYPYTGPGLMLSAQLPGEQPFTREKFIVLSDVTSEDETDPADQLERYAEAYLERYSTPTRRVTGVSLNLWPGPWGYLGVGSLISLRVTDATGSPVRQQMQVQGLEYAPAQGTLSLVLADPKLTEEL